jgi:hypothetical protein
LGTSVVTFDPQMYAAAGFFGGVVIACLVALVIGMMRRR